MVDRLCLFATVLEEGMAEDQGFQSHLAGASFCRNFRESYNSACTVYRPKKGWEQKLEWGVRIHEKVGAHMVPAQQTRVSFKNNLKMEINLQKYSSCFLWEPYLGVEHSVCWWWLPLATSKGSPNTLLQELHPTLPENSEHVDVQHSGRIIWPTPHCYSVSGLPEAAIQR